MSTTERPDVPVARDTPGAVRDIRRVLMTADGVGGVWPYALELAKALGERDIEVVLATMGPPLSDEQRSEARTLRTVALYESSYRLEWMDDPWDDVRDAGEWLLALEREVDPSIVHLNGYAHGALPWRAPVLVVGHSCVLSWWSAVHGCEPPVYWTRYASSVVEGLAGAQLVVAPSQAMRDELRRWYAPAADPVVIPNGRSSIGAVPTAKEPLVLAAGRVWDEAKNIAALCAVAPSLSWPVVIAGDATRPGASAPRTLEGVTLLGPVPGAGVRHWMSRASIYVLPARYEPFGLSALEAALAGCALVLGDIRSLREVWGDAAIYVPPDNRRALAAAIQELIHDPEQRQALGSRGRERARRYTPERMAEAYVARYEQMLEMRLAA
jgi:glycogen(starch) synthase